MGHQSRAYLLKKIRGNRFGMTDGKGNIERCQSRMKSSEEPQPLLVVGRLKQAAGGTHLVAAPCGFNIGFVRQLPNQAPAGQHLMVTLHQPCKLAANMALMDILPTESDSGKIPESPPEALCSFRGSLVARPGEVLNKEDCQKPDYHTAQNTHHHCGGSKTVIIAVCAG